MSKSPKSPKIMRCKATYHTLFGNKITKKSGTILVSHKDGTPPKSLKAADLEIPTKFGDVVAFSPYRDTKTYIVDINGNLIPNPDFSGSGYLTIPLEVTKYMRNATKFYQNVLILRDNSNIYVRHDDLFIAKAYGSALPATWKPIVHFNVLKNNKLKLENIYIESNGSGAFFPPKEYSIANIKKELR